MKCTFEIKLTIGHKNNILYHNEHDKINFFNFLALKVGSIKSETQWEPFNCTLRTKCIPASSFLAFSFGHAFQQSSSPLDLYKDSVRKSTLAIDIICK